MTQKLDKSLKNSTQKVSKFAGSTTKRFMLAGTAITSFVVTGTVGIAKFVKKLADAEDEIGEYAKSLGISRDEAYKTKSALDAMGKTMEEVNASADLRKQFEMLKENAEKLKPPDMSEGIQGVRDLMADFTKLKQTAQLGLQWIGHHLLVHLQKPIEDIRNGMGGITEFLTKNIPVWSEKIGKALSGIVRMGTTIIRGAAAVFKAIQRVFDMIPGNVKIAMAALAALATFIKMGPIGRLITILTAAILLLEDFFTFMDGGTSALAPLWQFLTDLFSGFTDGGENALDFFSNEFLPGLLNKIGEIFPQLVDKAMSFVDPLLDFAVNVITGLIDVITSNLPLLIKTAGEMLLAIVRGLVEKLPSILEAGATILQSLIEGIVEMIPELVDTAITLFETLLSILFDGDTLSKIIDAGINLVMTLIQGIVDALPAIIQAIIRLIDTLLKAIIQNLPKIIKAGIEIVLALVKGIGEALPDIVRAIIDLIFMIWDTLIENLPEIIKAGIEIVLALIEGLWQVNQQLAEIIVELGKVILDALKSLPAKMKEIGKGLIKALWEGIKSMGSWISDKVGGFFGGIWDGVKGLFDGGGGDPAPGGGGGEGHADGGIFDEPHVAPFAENHKAEAVVPLTKPKRALEVLGQVAKYFGGNLTDDKTAGMVEGVQRFVAQAMGVMDTMTQTLGVNSAVLAGGDTRVVYNQQHYDQSTSFKITGVDKGENLAKSVNNTLKKRNDELKTRNEKGVID